MTSPPAADLIITGARIETLDDAAPTASALAIAGERIFALGEDDAIAALAGPRTRRVDARGRRVIPGLIDGHPHMDREGLKEALPSLAGCRSIADITERIAALGDRGQFTYFQRDWRGICATRWK